MDVTELASGIRDSMSVKRVFGDPYERDGVTLIPVANVTGGGGGGGDNKPSGGSGGGFGVSAKPAGVYVLRDGKLSWEPALDLNRVILGGQVIALVAVLAFRGVLKARAKKRR